MNINLKAILIGAAFLFSTENLMAAACSPNHLPPPDNSTCEDYCCTGNSAAPFYFCKNTCYKDEDTVDNCDLGRECSPTCKACITNVQNSCNCNVVCGNVNRESRYRH